MTENGFARRDAETFFPPMPYAVAAKQLENYLGFVTPLVVLGEEMIRVAQRTAVARRPRRGATLRPGPRTPLWNAMVEMVRPRLTRRGEKSKLARILGVPPQRVHEYFGAHTHAPDAERTLLLLTWLAHRIDG